MYRGLSTERVFLYLKKNWFIFFAVAIYVFFTAYYMGPGFTKCSDSIYGFGDSTAGPIWRNSLKPEQPLFGGYETSTNYPYGESLYSPVGFASSFQTISMSVSSKFVGPMCAYNLYNITGYVLTALIMFFFIEYLTKNRWIALVAGYAVSFTPYVQSKVGGHPNYGFAGLLIALLWLTLHTLKYRRKRSAIMLGALLGLSAYVDPYFTLLSATVVGPSVSAWLCVVFTRTQKPRKTLLKKELQRMARPAMIALIAFIITLAPIGLIRVINSGAIDQAVSASRGNIFAAAMQCSNMPLDYLLPDPMNIHIRGSLGPAYSTENIQLRHWCGSGESRVSLSLTLIAIVLIAGIAALYRTARRKKNHLSLAYNATIGVTAVIFIGIAGLILGLPPRIHNLVMPSGVILKITEMWRIFAREYLVVNLALVILASIALYYLVCNVKLFKNKIAASVLFIAVFGGVLFEYQINDPFSPMTFSYSRDVPHVYETIKQSPQIQVIAEYPMDRIGVEHDSVVYYMTMQAVHGKKMVNSVLSTDSKMSSHISIKDLSDPQTIPALRYLGVHYVVVHGESVESILARTEANLELIEQNTSKVFGLSIIRGGEDNRVALFRIKDGPKQSSILTIEKGFAVNLPLLESPVASEYEILNNAVLKKTPLKKAKKNATSVCFDVKMSAKGDNGTLAIYQGQRLVSQNVISDEYSRIEVPNMVDSDSIRISNDRGYNMRLNNLSADCSIKERAP